MTYYFHVFFRTFYILSTTNDRRRGDGKKERKNLPKSVVRLFVPPERQAAVANGTHAYGSRCYNLFGYQICKSLFAFCYVVYFCHYDVQPQVIFPLEHCAMDAQHAVPAWRDTHTHIPHSFFQTTHILSMKFHGLEQFWEIINTI